MSDNGRVTSAKIYKELGGLELRLTKNINEIHRSILDTVETRHIDILDEINTNFVRKEELKRTTDKISLFEKGILTVLSLIIGTLVVMLVTYVLQSIKV